MLTANIHEAKTNLSKLIAQVLQGKEVIIAKAGKPVAKLVEYKEKLELRRPGLWKGKVWIPDDFNQESEEINKMFYGEDE
ncbi:MAG: Prevent-host-death family protein [Candidatus Woesebacteria bacterium GW2011_GWB1_38_8]|uniref:Antitoxin n=2 Tax=Candidatus Woeseibacteriota TaxID=1752722 RepID=A0A0G0NI38_9BACT|nr:MAG: Prevent-host-death family protein [Candidatus Woesebacteria bacterium GW2011_GWB1_38_8]OGM20906.1 MAG: antitoxin [Candidatus Woesebacteria bacterium RIFCSPHIGHO2_01_FULL_38_9b]